MESKILLEHYDFGILVCVHCCLLTKSKALLRIPTRILFGKTAEFSWCYMNSKKLFGHYDFLYFTVGCVLTKFYFLDDLNKQVSTCWWKAKKQKDNSQKLKKANKPLNPKNQNIIWTLWLCVHCCCVLTKIYFLDDLLSKQVGSG